jgi:DNA-binding response OmpR family regulator
VAFRGNTTIVVVEEQAAVQELIDLALRESSSCVLATSDRLEVVEVARRVRIDLLVIDVLVDRGGLSLVQDLRALQPCGSSISAAGTTPTFGTLMAA